MWDEVPGAMTVSAMHREATLLETAADVVALLRLDTLGITPESLAAQVASQAGETGQPLEGGTVKKVGDEWVLYHPSGREVARSTDKKLLTDYRDQKITSAKTAGGAWVTPGAVTCVNDGRPASYMVTGPEGDSPFFGVCPACLAKVGPDEITMPLADYIAQGYKVMASAVIPEMPFALLEMEQHATHLVPDPNCSLCMDHVASRTAAKPKGNRAPDEPTQQSMRPITQIRQSPSADQLKARKRLNRRTYGAAPTDGGLPGSPQDLGARKQMARKQATTEESTMRTEAKILSEMATASLADQRALAVELDQMRHAKSASLRADREVDLADTMVRAHLTPILVHARHTTATDWVDTEPEQGDPTLAMKTEATLWFQRTSAEVRDDLEEFAIQAQGKATQLASREGEMADVAFDAFIGQVDHLYRQAAKVTAGDTIDKDKANGNAESGLPTGVDNDDTAFDDGGFLDDDDDSGVHPPMPGAGEKTSSHEAAAFDPEKASVTTSPYTGPSGASTTTTAPDTLREELDDPNPKKDPRLSPPYASQHTAADGDTCSSCGASIEHDPAGEDPSTWHHNDGSSHDHEATPKSAAKQALKIGDMEAYDATCPNKDCKENGTAFVHDDLDGGTDSDDEQALCPECDTPLVSQSGKTSSRHTAEAEQNGNGKATTTVQDPDTDPQYSEDWDGTGPKPGSGAADVKNAKNPNDHTSMLTKAAAFRATVQANLAKD